MLDIAVSYNKYKFLGNEFLTWLWYIVENERERLLDAEGIPASMEIGKRIVFEIIKDDSILETLTIKGDNAGLEEGLMALKKGSVVTELSLVYREGSQEWYFNLKGESFNLSGFKHPETAPVEKKEEVEGYILEKAFLVEKAVGLLDALYKQFIKLRISEEWTQKALPGIKGWINQQNM